MCVHWWPQHNCTWNGWTTKRAETDLPFKSGYVWSFEHLGTHWTSTSVCVFHLFLPSSVLAIKLNHLISHNRIDLLFIFQPKTRTRRQNQVIHKHEFIWKPRFDIDQMIKLFVDALWPLVFVRKFTSNDFWSSQNCTCICLVVKL